MIKLSHWGLLPYSLRVGLLSAILLALLILIGVYQ